MCYSSAKREENVVFYAWSSRKGASMSEQTKANAHVTALLVAQDAFKDDRKRSHIYGVFDSLGAPTFPVNIPFTVYCRLVGQGTHTVFLRIIDSLEEILVKTDAFHVEVTFQKGHELFLQFGVQFKAPGLYKVQAFVDGVPELEAPLYVRQASPPPESPEQTQT